MKLNKWLMPFAAAAVLTAGTATVSESKIKAVAWQTVYVPVYSSIYHGDREREFNLAVTLSVRNTDTRNSITLERVDYYDTAGKILKRYLEGKQILKPMESVQYLVRESDIKGGPGANFIVAWRSSRPVSAPVIESIMIGTGGQQGISFTSRGVVTREE
ncbi:MAG TPA: DUF3124 domain-containing protein [Spirochaetota bacterium]|nr:DUF3124 domain-containing protein [Spirochaetota bacterium]HPC40260.1 DUF3124 domain-containing protein [Spirochaetota bacterium]HPL15303.1 DUF3124 domain-containing protein [Spirochaetota bacterium]HQF07265.1 DUF3124 domain-containing protein [Spirochaetota bacterium]HQH96166.1 DUF3124 domain-containing protein [Spirochaetota bacterium]